MPVTHGVAGSSPVQTARNNKSSEKSGLLLFLAIPFGKNRCLSRMGSLRCDDSPVRPCDSSPAGLPYHQTARNNKSSEKSGLLLFLVVPFGWNKCLSRMGSLRCDDSPVRRCDSSPAGLPYHQTARNNKSSEKSGLLLFLVVSFG